MTDIFREVDEDLRHARYKQLWDRYGIYVIGVAVLIVVGTAAWRGWEYWQAKQAAASGDRYLQAVELAEGSDHNATIAALEKVAGDASGEYPLLARMRAASEKAMAGDREAAAAEFDAIAVSASTPANLQVIARLRAAIILADSLDLAQIRARVGDLAAAGQPYRHTARELIGMTAWRVHDYAAAREIFNEILEDEATPQNLRQRAAIMADLIDSRLGPPSDG